MNTEYRAYLAPLGRLLLVAVFLLSGAGKLADPSGTIAFIGSTGAPLPAAGYALSVAIRAWRQRAVRLSATVRARPRRSLRCSA